MSLDLSPKMHRLNLNAGSLQMLKTRAGHTARLATSANFVTWIFFFYYSFSFRLTPYLFSILFGITLAI